jgi:hypothetical protein
LFFGYLESIGNSREKNVKNKAQKNPIFEVREFIGHLEGA